MASGGAATPTPAAAVGGTSTSTSKTVSPSLWWDSFVDLSDDLDRAAATPSVPDPLVSPSSLPIPHPSLVPLSVGCDRWLPRAVGEADQEPPRVAAWVGLHVREAERGVEECAGRRRGRRWGAPHRCQAGAPGGRASCEQVPGKFASPAPLGWT